MRHTITLIPGDGIGPEVSRAVQEILAAACFFFSSRRRHTRSKRDWSSDVCSSDLLDMGADGVLIPYINTADEARQAVSCTKYPTAGTRSVYFPQRSMNKAGLLGYAGNFNNNGIIALQVETASCIENIVEIASVPGVDILFLGQNDLCMSMGLFEKYKFPDMYTSPELGAATQKLIDNARKNNVILGLFLFGTARVGEFLEKGFTFISVGNDLHHVLTQTGAYVNDLEGIAKAKGKSWKRRPTALF